MLRLVSCVASTIELNQQFSGINTEILQDTMKEMLLLNTAFQENMPFYEVHARDHVISELTDPVSRSSLVLGCLGVVNGEETSRWRSCFYTTWLASGVVAFMSIGPPFPFCPIALDVFGMRLVSPTRYSSS